MQDSHCGTIYLVGRVGQGGSMGGGVGGVGKGSLVVKLCQAMVSTHVCLWGVFNLLERAALF